MTAGVRMLGAAAGLLTATMAFAGTISDPVIQITASSSQGTGTLNIPFNPANFDPATFTYRFTLAAPVDITSGANVIATVDNLSTMLICDPLVNLGFVVTAGGANAHVTIKSALLSFAAINNAHGTASAQIGITDNDGNGATLTGGGAGGMGYLAQYNGYVPGGTTFASLVPSFSVGTFGSDNRNGNVPDTPIVPPVTNMSSQFDFTITANDSASGTSVYVITPEPGSLALLVLGGLALIRRRG